jgi:hypothetical protein
MPRAHELLRSMDCNGLKDWRQRGITRCRHGYCRRDRRRDRRCHDHRCRRDRRRQQDRRPRPDHQVRHCCRRALDLSADGLPVDRQARYRSADGCPADGLPAFPADLADERLADPAGPVRANHAIRRDHPSRGHGANENRTGTSRVPAIRPGTSKSVCRDRRTELCRCLRAHRPLDASQPAQSAQLARGRQSSPRRMRAPGPQ